MLFAEPMSRHTTFRIGGPADAFVTPEEPEELAGLFALLHAHRVPTFILGAGANILVSDPGIRGVVIDLSAMRGIRLRREGDRRLVSALAGTQVQELCAYALAEGLSGVEFLAHMPGSVGGSVYMNARCYSHSISEILSSVEVIDPRGGRTIESPEPERFDYKRSPYQGRAALILEATVELVPGERLQIGRRMEEIHADRTAKGHFLHPCAGSVFKNNRAFGRPSGAIIDSLGLRGYRSGGAQISDRHANIVVNTGGATAKDVLSIMTHVEGRVREAFGFHLEREILLVGEWKEAPDAGTAGKHAGVFTGDGGPGSEADGLRHPHGRAARRLGEPQ